MNKHPFELEKHRLPCYEQFAASYGLQDLETLVRLYEIDDLEAFLPVNPSESEKLALQTLIGVEGVEGYMDYQKSNHTFELIMQWQEQTGNQAQTAFSLIQPMASHKAAPPSVGMFDSGLGGLSVWRELVQLMPGAPVVYAADSGRCPYGNKPKEDIIRYSREMTQFLLSQGASLIVVACNTATAAAISTLREEFDVPFVGMEPALKPAAEASRSGVVAILATEGTFRGQHFARARDRFAANTRLLLQVGHGLVEWVEAGQLEGPLVEEGLRNYLEPMLEAGADQIVLGCTHYPFLRKAMEVVIQGRATIVDPAPAVARQVQRLWNQLPERSSVTVSDPWSWFTSGNPLQMQALLAQMGLGETVR